MIDAMTAAQQMAFDTWDKPMPRHSSVEHVMSAGFDLSKLVDAEIRHVSMIERGLQQTLSRLFIECVQVMRGGDIQLPTGARLRLPMEPVGVCTALVDNVFKPKNEAYGNSFARFGAVGVVVRLMDKLAELEDAHAAWIADGQRGPLPKPLPHVANYATMTLVVMHPDLGT